MKKSFIIALLLVTINAVTPYTVLAEEQTETTESTTDEEEDDDTEDGYDPPPPPVEDDPDAPIDGGLGLLIAGGIGYGIKKYRSAKKERTEK